MDFVVDIHAALFNMQTLYSFIIGIYAAWLGAQEKPLSGNFFGTIAIYAILNVIVLAIGLILLFNDYTVASDERVFIYILYMLFLIVILPGLFTIMQGRDDRRAAMIFGAFAMFNAAVSYSMFARGLATWVLATGA